MFRNNVKLLDREEITRRLARMIGEPYRNRMNEVTRNDVARWFGIDIRYVRFHSKDPAAINDFWQVTYSDFFALLDAGRLALRFDPQGRKVLVRIPESEVKPQKKTPRPYVDLTTMKLGFDG